MLANDVLPFRKIIDRFWCENELNSLGIGQSVMMIVSADLAHDQINPNHAISILKFHENMFLFFDPAHLELTSVTTKETINFIINYYYKDNLFGLFSFQKLNDHTRLPNQIDTMEGVWKSASFQLSNELDHLLKNKNHNIDINKCVFINEKIQKRTILVELVAYNLKNNPSLTRLLNSHKLNPNTACENSKKETALHIATKKQYLNSMKALLKHPEIDANIQDNRGRTPVFSAALNNWLESLQELLKFHKTNPNITPNDGHNVSPLHIAIHNGNTECAITLIQTKSTNINQQMHDGSTPLLQVCQNGNMPVLNALLSRHDLNPHIKTNHGIHPLFIAALKNQTKVISALLKAYKFNLSDTEYKRDTALIVARKRNHHEAENLLLHSDNIL